MTHSTVRRCRFLLCLNLLSNEWATGTDICPNRTKKASASTAFQRRRVFVPCRRCAHSLMITITNKKAIGCISTLTSATQTN
ncbi:MAG: hypothetical protein J3R72DRAFT_460712 [Linnemannia gamsii]|nr:MAG: hypothetical protein J3R72DRAFT_460712 [Linnemannia gamsii]